MLAEICVDAVLCSGEEENGFGFDTVKVFVTNGYEVPKFLRSLRRDYFMTVGAWTPLEA